MWRNELLTGLVWAPDGPPKDNPRPDQEYIAPTWSCASRPGVLLCYLHLNRDSRDAGHQATVLNAWTVLKGPVSDGAIVLPGVHFDVKTMIPERDGYIQLDFGHGEVKRVC